MSIVQIDPIKLKELRERISIAAAEFDKQLDEEYEIPEDVSTYDCMRMSESALKRIWDTPEEDEAWKYL